MRGLITIVLTAVIATACGSLDVDPPVIDGWAVGDALDCSASPDCGRLAMVALLELDRSEPDHAAAVAWSIHREGQYRDRRTGNRILPTRSGGAPDILVVTLADGRTVAIGVGYLGVSREPIAVREGPAALFGLEAWPVRRSRREAGRVLAPAPRG
jgi:hypothetical protein